MSEPSRYRRTVHISEPLAAVMAAIAARGAGADGASDPASEALLTAEEYTQLSNDVQFGRCSWPVAIEIQEPVHG